MQADSKDLRHLYPLSSSLQTATILRDVKVECTDPHITLLSDDLDTKPLPSVKDGHESLHVSIRSTSRDA